MSAKVLNYTQFPIKSTATLKKHPNNPNQHPRAQIDALCEILIENGWRAPVVVSKRSGLVIKGHGRIEAAERLGIGVPVEEQDYPDEAAEIRDLIADNKIQELSQLNGETVEKLVAKFKITSGYGQIAKTGSFEKCLHKVADEAPKARKYPIVILENEEQYNMFERIKADMGGKGNGAVFARILQDAYMGKYGEE